jgi:hypothetical protein
MDNERIRLYGLCKDLKAYGIRVSEIGLSFWIGQGLAGKAVNFLKNGRNPHKLKVLAIHFRKVPLRMIQ